MKSLIASIMILGLVGMVVGVAVKAGDTITATVEPKLIAVSVTDGSVDYGVLGYSTTEDTATLEQTQLITNDSNVIAKFDVKSSDATGGTTPWELVASTSIASDEFGHQYDIDTIGFADFPITNDYVNDVVTLDESGGTDDNADLDLKIFMPTGSTDTTGTKTITVTVRVHE